MMTPEMTITALLLLVISLVLAIVVHFLLKTWGEYDINKIKLKATLAREDKQSEYDHLEQTQKIANLEKSNQRKDALEDQKCQQIHKLSTKGQDHMFEILKGTFDKVKEVDLNQATYAACILQNLQPGKVIDNAMLEMVADKVSPPAAIDLDRIVENVILKYDQNVTEDEAEVK